MLTVLNFIEPSAAIGMIPVAECRMNLNSETFVQRHRYKGFALIFQLLKITFHLSDGVVKLTISRSVHDIIRYRSANPSPAQGDHCACTRHRQYRERGSAYAC